MKNNTYLKNLVRDLPKTELHVHIEGTLEPDQMLEFARRNQVKIPYRSASEVEKAYKFTDLQSFLNIYYNAMRTLIDEQDFYDLAMAYTQKAASQGVVHAEIFFDPQAHTTRSVSFKTVIQGLHNGLEEARLKFGVTSNLIMCFIRDMSPESSMETLDEALKYKSLIKAVGLDSKELGNPPQKFSRVYSRAVEEGFLTVAHAGEEAPADYIWQALNLLKVSRIDHGYHMFEDPNLVSYISNKRIPVTICPLAAVGVGYFKSVSDIPIKRMLDLGIVANINSDDPAYFKGYIADNFDALIDSNQLSREDIIKLLSNSFEASFLSRSDKDEHIRKLHELSTTTAA
jgi:adenosine deaminase